jgi:glycosyltransferase involved in cell wall biosynthesis
MKPEKKRITILYSRLSGYTLASLYALKTQHDVELMVFYWGEEKNAPFELGKLDWIDHYHNREQHSVEQIEEIVLKFAPHGVYMSGWMDKGYLEVAKKARLQGIPVIAGLDGQWNGTLRQRVGSTMASRLLHPAIDVIWAAGDRQAQFAKRLGYSGSRCWRGLYCCDWGKFARVPEVSAAGAQKAFLYTGRYVPVKGIGDLVEAYKMYRTQVESPWELHCAGTGELQHLLKDQAGIVDFGFVQPDRLPELMKSKSAFILPSHSEPWGVVLQEAAAAGLPLLCTEVCGASVHLLQDGYNGFLFEPASPKQLTHLMIRLHNLSLEEQVEMGNRSYELSKQFKPSHWAKTLMDGLRDFKSV